MVREPIINAIVVASLVAIIGCSGLFIITGL